MTAVEMTPAPAWVPGGRILVRFPAALVARPDWPAIHVDWRATFVTCPGPRKAYYRAAVQAWSVSPDARTAVFAWAEAHHLAVDES